MTGIVNGTVPDDVQNRPTSATGAMHPNSLSAVVRVMRLTTVADSATAVTYEPPRIVERTTAGQHGQIRSVVPPESTGEAVLEVRRRSGLTWEELGDLFGVSRRSVHHWASGKPASAAHERLIRRMLAAIRCLDQGSQSDTRRKLLATSHVEGHSVFEMLKERRFTEVMPPDAMVGEPERPRPTLSRKAWDMRRPQPPVSLLEAEQDGQAERPGRARLARAVRVPRKTDARKTDG